MAAYYCMMWRKSRVFIPTAFYKESFGMYSNEIECVIAEYLKNPKAEYAVMIDGDWGSGKTYFLTHSLMRIMETIDIGKDKRRK